MIYEPQAQLIVAAIAAFVANDRHRVLPIAQETWLGITMVGASPIFYKIPITQALVTAQHPAQPAIVQRFVPTVANPIHYARDGMRPLGNRVIVFQCLEAMGDLMVSPLSCQEYYDPLLVFSVIPNVVTSLHNADEIRNPKTMGVCLGPTPTRRHPRYTIESQIRRGGVPASRAMARALVLDK